MASEGEGGVYRASINKDETKGERMNIDAWEENVMCEREKGEGTREKRDLEGEWIKGRGK